MIRRPKSIVIFFLLIAGLLVPRISALALHLNPNIMAIVICTGTEMVTIHIGADGHPIETTEAEQTLCILADAHAETTSAYTQWTKVPRSYRATFVENAMSVRSEAEVGLLPDLRGPPFVI